MFQKNNGIGHRSNMDNSRWQRFIHVESLMYNICLPSILAFDIIGSVFGLVVWKEQEYFNRATRVREVRRGVRRQNSQDKGNCQICEKASHRRRANEVITDDCPS